MTPQSEPFLRTLRRWFQTRAVARPGRRAVPSVRQLAEEPAGWSGPGPVRVTHQHLVLGTGRQRRRASLGTVASVAREGAAVWVHRRRAHDWLVRCADEAGAARVVEALRAATDTL